jgi:hypothetical protein
MILGYLLQALAPGASYWHTGSSVTFSVRPSQTPFKKLHTSPNTLAVLTCFIFSIALITICMINIFVPSFNMSPPLLCKVYKGNNFHLFYSLTYLEVPREDLDT